jgi:hypothetical protein
VNWLSCVPRCGGERAPTVILEEQRDEGSSRGDCGAVVQPYTVVISSVVERSLMYQRAITKSLFNCLITT